MKILSLASKKLNLMFGSEHECREQIFKECYLLHWYKVIRHSPGLTLKQTEEFCRDCNKFDIQVLGFETSYESRHGLNTYCFEEYDDVYQDEWWYAAFHDLHLNGITDSIIPYIHIPQETLDNYLPNAK